MKLIHSLTLSFLLFVFITNLSFVFSSDESEQVLDIYGTPVVAGSEYYILPSSGRRGGLELGKISNSNCEVTVMQAYTRYLGIPVKFTYLKNSTEKILTNTSLVIEVIEKPDCAESSKWLAFVDSINFIICVGIGGSGNYNNYFPIFPGTFSILKHGSGYKFGFCAEFYTCFDIGISQQIGEDGKRLHLVGQMLQNPYEIVFVPGSIETGIIKSVV